MKNSESKIIAFGALGLAAILIAGRIKKQSGVGKAERIKRRIYKEVSLAQGAGVDFTKKYPELSKEEKKALERVGKSVAWKQSKRSKESETYTESYYGSLRRAWNAVSGVQGIGTTYDVKDANGNVCLTWIEDAASHVARENDAEQKRQRALETEARIRETKNRMRAQRNKIDRDGMLPTTPVAPVAPVVEKPKKQTAQKRKEAEYDERLKFAKAWMEQNARYTKELFDTPLHVENYRGDWNVSDVPNNAGDALIESFARGDLKLKGRNKFKFCGEWFSANGITTGTVASHAEGLLLAWRDRELNQGFNNPELNNIRRELLDKAKHMMVKTPDGEMIKGDDRYNYLDYMNYVVMVKINDYNRAADRREVTIYPVYTVADRDMADGYVRRFKLNSKDMQNSSLSETRTYYQLPIWEVDIQSISGISGIGALSVEDGLEPELLEYVRNNVDDRRMSIAFDEIDHMRCPLSMAEPVLYDDIVNLVDEWCEDNAIDPDSVWDIYDPEDIFWAL